MCMFVFGACHKIYQRSLAAVTSTNGPLSGLMISFITNLQRCQHKTVQSTGIWVVSLVKLAQERNTARSAAGVLWAGSLRAASQALRQDPVSLNVKASIHAWPGGSLFFMKIHLHLSSKGVEIFQAEKWIGPSCFFCHSDLRNGKGRSRHRRCRVAPSHTRV